MTSTKIAAVVSFINIISVLVMISQAFSNKVLASIRNLWSRWKCNFPCIQNCLIFQNWLLRLIMAKRFFTKQKFKENYTNWPYIYLVWNLWTILGEAFWCLIPICTNSLWSQLYLFISLINNLAKSEVCYFDLSIVEDNVLGFKIVVNNLFIWIVQILKTTQNLWYY